MSFTVVLAEVDGGRSPARELSCDVVGCTTISHGPFDDDADGIAGGWKESTLGALSRHVCPDCAAKGVPDWWPAEETW